MDDLAAQRLARAVLEPGEALLWSEAAPSQPAAAVHFAIALILLIVAAGVVWVGLQAWRLGLPAARELKNKLLTVLSVVALGGATIAGVVAIVLLSIFAAINVAKAANDGSAAYMITDRRAGFVYGLSSTRYVEPLELSLLRITRTGNSLRLGQPLGTEVFGVVLDPVFYQVSDPNRVAALLRRVAEETTSPPPLRVAPMPTDQGTLAAISSALYASERVIWAQRADGRPGGFQATAVSIASGSIGFVLLIAALLGALQAKRRWFMLGIIAPAGIALSLVAVANAGRALGAGSLYYALTNQRVIIVRVEPWFAVRSYEPFFFDETMRVYADDNSVISCRIAATRGCQGVRLDGVHHADAVVAAIRAQLAGREP